MWTRIHGLDLGRSHGDAVRRLLTHVSRIELIPEVLDRARAPFPVPVRTLDALHLATAHWLAEQGHPVEIATYDGRLAGAAEAIGLTLFDLAQGADPDG